MILCDSCGRESDHFFLRVKGNDEFWICHRCVNLERDIIELLETECLNTMEICRIFNGVDNPKDCVKGQKFGAIRGYENCCRGKELNCTFHYWDIAKILRKLERKGRIKSVKTRFWDITPLRTDLFRFWFVHYKNFQERVLRQKLDGYITDDGLKRQRST